MEASTAQQPTISQSRRNVLKSIGAAAVLLLGGTVATTPASAATRRQGVGSVHNVTPLQLNAAQQELLTRLTAGQGLWFQEDYMEPVQYITWIPATRTHAFFKFSLGNAPSPWHGLGHRDTMIKQPGGFTFSPNDGLVVNHLWNLSPYQDDQGQTRWILFLNLNTSHVGTEFQQEVIEILGYDQQSDAFSVYNHTNGREGVWRHYA